MVSAKTVPQGKRRPLMSTKTVPFRKGKALDVHQDSTLQKEGDPRCPPRQYPSERGRPLMTIKTVPFRKGEAFDDHQISTLQREGGL